MAFEIKPRDIFGKRFGRLLVLSESKPASKWKTFVKCKCDCGAEKFIREDHIKSGRSKICGCLNREATLKSNSKHGGCRRSGHAPEFDVWVGMNSRCHNPSYPAFYRYGGRGISVCEKWHHSYANFISDMGRKPTPSHTIERLNNNGNYEPSNCKWATRKEQANNRRTNHFMTHAGKTLTASQWSEILGIHSLTLVARSKRGWSDEKTLTTPLR